MTSKGEKVGPRRRSSDADAVPPFDPHPDALPTAAESASTNPVSASSIKKGNPTTFQV
jgi:hypothetical protein